MSERQVIDVSVSAVLAKLKAGETREEIATHYGLTMAEAKRDVFSHPKLKNKKPHKVSRVVLVDDVPEVVMVDDTITSKANLANADLQEEMSTTSEEIVSEIPETIQDQDASQEQEEPATEEMAQSPGPEATAGSW